MKKFFLLLALLLLIPVANAQSTYQYAKIYLSPFYRSGMTQNVNYTYSISISPPDGISEVKSALIFFQIYITPTVEFYLWVNNKSCNPPSFLIHTTYMDAGYSVISFDCSNVIKKEGNYTIILRPTQANTGSAIGWLDLTYVPRKISMNVFSTEYLPLTQGKIFLQYLDQYGNPINDGMCMLDIFRPNNSVYFKKVVMDYIPNSDGLYAFDFITPEEEGVYPVSAFCTHPTEFLSYVANGFVLFSGTEKGGHYSYTWELDGNFHFLGASNSSYYFNYTFNLTNKIISIDWYGKSAGNVYFYFYNCSSGRYEPLPNNLINPSPGLIYRISNTLSNLTCQDFFAFNIRSTKDIYNDFILLRIFAPETFQLIRGGGEMHITDLVRRVNETLNVSFEEIRNRLKEILDYLSNTSNITLENLTIIREKIEELLSSLSYVNETVVSIKNDTEQMMFLLQKLDLILEKIENVSELINYTFNETNNSLELIKLKLNEMKSEISEIKNTGEITLEKIILLVERSDEIYNMTILLSSTLNETSNNTYAILNEIGEIKDILNALNITVNITGNITEIAEGMKTIPADVWKQFLKLGTPPLMHSTEYYCKDNTTLVKNITFTFCENHKCDVYSKVEEIKCDWGCDASTASCAPNPFFKYLIVILIIVGMGIFIYFVFGRRYYG